MEIRDTTKQERKPRAAAPLGSRRHPAVRAIPLALILWTALMILLTIPAQATLREGLSVGATKFGHTALFFGWTILLGLYLMVYRGRRSVRLGRLFVLTVVFGAAIEILQFILPFGRSGSPADLLWNSAGAAPACLVLWHLRARITAGAKSPRPRE